MTLKATPTVFLAWQDPTSGVWFPIGRLTFDGEIYQFVYLRGATEAEEKAAFKPLASFPRSGEIYTSTQLFPVFANRLMSTARPDYSSFISVLALAERSDDLLAILTRSGGERVTDTLAIFPDPKADEEGKIWLDFFVRGLRDLPKCAIERIQRLELGEELGLSRQLFGRDAVGSLMLSTSDRYLVGRCPGYLQDEIVEGLEGGARVEVVVERVNPLSTPLQFRLLCKLGFEGGDDFRLYQRDRFQPLIPTLAMPC